MTLTLIYASSPASWYIWNIQKGQSDTIRKHLRNHHRDKWSESVIENKLKGWESLGYKGGTAPQGGKHSTSVRLEPFTPSGLERRIIQFIARGDHVRDHGDLLECELTD